MKSFACSLACVLSLCALADAQTYRGRARPVVVAPHVNRPVIVNRNFGHRAPVLVAPSAYYQGGYGYGTYSVAPYVAPALEAIPVAPQLEAPAEQSYAAPAAQPVYAAPVLLVPGYDYGVNVRTFYAPSYGHGGFHGYQGFRTHGGVRSFRR